MADDFPDFVKFEGFAGQAWYHQHMREKRILRRAREFTPERLLEKGEQGVWYDPSDTTTLFQDSAGTTPVTASGQPVGRMLDKSGRGNHATQPTAASRPIYRRGDSRGVVNLLTWSEDFSNAVWVKAFGGAGVSPVVTANYGLAPNGELSAERIEFNTGGVGVNDQSYISRSIASPIAGSGTGGLWLKKNSPGTVELYVRSGSKFSGSAQKVTVTDQWGFFSETQVGADRLWFGLRGTVTAGQTADILAWGAQLNLGPTALPYQRNDGNLGGVATGASTDLHWLETDGVDDGMATGNIDFTGTDKVSVFAGVRKLSDAAVGSVAELGADVGTVNGSFQIRAPATAAANYAFNSRGTLTGFAVSPSTSPAPNSSVLTGAGSISGDVTSVRVNGVVTTVATDQGTGNYGKYRLYLFRRGGTSLPFNGWFYGLAITGRLTTDAETVATERYLAAKASVVLP